MVASKISSLSQRLLANAGAEAEVREVLLGRDVEVVAHVGNVLLDKNRTFG